ncbi:hypothetical protein [Flavobacterium phage V157]|uniref:Uncharacterized protein n=20 Tax=Ficleduovirus TaxID=2560131 RepID=A0A0A0YSW6_9CAUD|nr:hypothetical protein ABG42_gp03 [Flavobacterium phage FCL-2]YP_009591089.1 hypothetical protein FDG55_gp03 [Flavobacterium phage FCV-1]ASD51587.1 hypothetical protein [Flavobacterium phage FCV-3]ASD51661.1 hypothetical protein [Flavobacterium phage FCV-11]ASD51735.1 hypothetical protein [Flavobacterium phage V175]ASD51813.1 hypothetical protein [Flavobacterium phage V181]ASD52491.1 hypothetical protein [Flavobacterium phage FCV-10]ASD52564.1 hypothetical protein [Flavobacterium phage FCV-
MANLKYKEETKIISFRVPISKIPRIRKLVNKELSGIKEELERPEFPENRNDFAQIKKVKCDCKLDENGLLRRGKIKCTKSKSEHKF